MLMLRFVWIAFYPNYAYFNIRNLVTSLLNHEQIKTTLPKARDTARLAEKVLHCIPAINPRALIY